MESGRAGSLERVSARAGDWTGRNAAFGVAVVLVAGWLLSGPFFHYSSRWESFINTVTSVVTFLMVFLIQRAQNKDTLALQLKVNELIAAHKHAHNSLIAIEGLSEDELHNLHLRFLDMATMARGDATVTGRLDVAAAPADADSAGASR